MGVPQDFDVVDRSHLMNQGRGSRYMDDSSMTRRERPGHTRSGKAIIPPPELPTDTVAHCQSRLG